MATVVKDFKVKSGLIVEGSTAKVNNFDVLTKKQADQDYIVSLIGGTSTPINTPDTVVKRDNTGSFAAGTITAETGFSGNLTGDVTGNADTATALETSRTIELTGDVTGSVSFDGTSNVQISTTLDSAFATDLEVATAKSEAIADANAYTDQEILNAVGEIPTSTDELSEGTTNLYYTDTRARNAVSAGDGLDYNSSTGVFSADLGYGLQVDGNGQIEIDDNVVATDQNVTDAVSAHSNATTGVHGVTGNVVGTSDAQELTNKTLGAGTILSANVDADGFTVTNLPEPTNASDAATKGYVDAVAEGLHVHASVALATTQNVTLVPAPATIDNIALVTLAAGARILVKSQTNSAENGIYEYNGTDLVRAADYNTVAEIDPGDFVYVIGGDTYANTGWVQTAVVTTLGTSAIIWDQFSGAGTYTAGNGLTLNGTEFAINTTVTATKTYVDDEIDAHAALTSTHGVGGDLVGTTDTQTLTNKTLGSGTVLGADLDATNTYKVVNLVDPTANQDAATKKYVDDAVSAVDNAVENLTTADVAEDPNYLYFTDGRAKDSAAALLTTATLTNITITGTGNGGLTITAENGVADSTTSDLVEGTNLYFTDERAVDAVAAAISGGTQTNISVTYNATTDKFDFVAENGVADSTTDDLDEGNTNLYFTDERAVLALEAVVPNFTEIDVNSVATQVASSLTVPTASQVVAYSVDTTEYTSAKFLVKVKTATHSELSEVLVTLDGSGNVAITEYAIVGTNGSMSTITAGMNGADLELLVTTTNNNSTVTVMGTLLV